MNYPLLALLSGRALSAARGPEPAIFMVRM